MIWPALPDAARRRCRLPPIEPAHRFDGRHVTIVEKDCNATAISMGFPIDVLRGSKDWYALALANCWLGQHRNQNGHLYQVIREARGLNYGDYSYIEHFPNAGGLFVPPTNVCRSRQIFEIWIRPVPNAARHFALRAALRELQKFVDHGMTEERVPARRGSFCASSCSTWRRRRWTGSATPWTTASTESTARISKTSAARWTKSLWPT